MYNFKNFKIFGEIGGVIKTKSELRVWYSFLVKRGCVYLYYGHHPDNHLLLVEMNNHNAELITVLQIKS